jgi:RNA recognition motif-containing protein
VSLQIGRGLAQGEKGTMQPSQNSNNDAGKDPSKLYIGNLSYSMGEDDLRNVFSEYGEIEECKLITDYRTGRSKGFAFVKFSSAEEASAAIEALNEQDIEGRKIFVKVAMPPKPRDDRRGGYDNRRRDR